MHNDAEIRIPSISVFDLAVAISAAIDLASPQLLLHHRRVAFLTSRLCVEMELDPAERHDAVVAALLHDVGAVAIVARGGFIDDEGDETNHAEIGYELLNRIPPLRGIARIVRHHHRSWAEEDVALLAEEEAPRASHIVNLADEAVRRIRDARPIHDQIDALRGAILGAGGWPYDPSVASAFEMVLRDPDFWDALVQGEPDTGAFADLISPRPALAFDDLLNIARLFGAIVDLRTPYTAAHSFGVAATATALGRLRGLDTGRCRALELAGHLHEIGRFAAPPGEDEGFMQGDRFVFSDLDWRLHCYHTLLVLGRVPPLQEIALWAAANDDGADGEDAGPGLDGVSEEARILAVADRFVTLTENRAYRGAMSEEDVREALLDFASCEMIDEQVVATLLSNYTEIDRARREAQAGQDVFSRPLRSLAASSPTVSERSVPAPI